MTLLSKIEKAIAERRIGEAARWGLVVTDDGGIELEPWKRTKGPGVLFVISEEEAKKGLTPKRWNSLFTRIRKATGKGSEVQSEQR